MVAESSYGAAEAEADAHIAYTDGGRNVAGGAAASPLTPTAAAAASASVWRRPLRRSVAAVAAMAMVTGSVALVRTNSMGRAALAASSGLAASESTPSPDSGLTVSNTNAAKAAAASSGCDGCPSIIMITLDDVGYNDLGYVSSDLPFVSPNLDQLAANGVKLTEYYGQSICTPARTTLMSGKFVHRTGFNTQQGRIEIFPISNYSVPLSHKLLPEYMQGAGYATHVIGKWNIGHCHQDYLPWNRGADTFLGYTGAGVTYDSHRAYGNASYPNPSTGGPTELFDMLDGRSSDDWEPATSMRGAYTTHLFTERAVEHVENHMETESSSRPMFMWLAFHAAHDDPDAHPPTADLPQYDVLMKMTGDEGLGHKRVMAALTLTDLDNSIGSLVATMNTTGMLENSVIIVNSDNGGDPCGEHLVGDNHPLRGSKMTYFQGGLKVPGFIYSPNKAYIPHQARGTTYDGLMHHVDWVRTIYEGVVGRSLDDDGYDTSTLDSLNHWQAITADPDDPQFADSDVRDNIIFALTNHYMTVIKRVGGSDIKVMKNMFNSSWFGDAKETNNAMMCNQNMEFDEFNFMFNLTSDPMERSNMWDHPEKQDQLNDLVDWAAERYDDEYYHPPLVFGDELERDDIYTYFYGNDSFIVPWGCSTLE